MNILRKIEDKISRDGNLSIADYMTLCLYDPEAGYYTTRDPLGAEGDFITVPEMTQMFGELLGLWVADCWIKMGRPQTLQLIEAGPGRGTLMLDMLRAISQVMPPLAEVMTVRLVEVSPTLQNKQRETLSAHTNITWHTQLADLSLEEPTIFVANELLDAMPVRQYFLRNGTYYERLVTLECGGLAFTLADTPTDVGHDGMADNAPAVITQTPLADALLQDLRTRLTHGYALLVDYGGSGHADTLQAQKNHKMVDPLAHPGESDLTTHVNFPHIRAILGEGASTEVDMSPFLLSLGLAARAGILMEKAATEAESAKIATVTRKLVDPNEMGQHFKVQAYRSAGLPVPAGFND